jgi:hypothetical protein
MDVKSKSSTSDKGVVDTAKKMTSDVGFGHRGRRPGYREEGDV